MTRFLKKLLGFETLNSSSAKRNNSIRLSVETLEGRVLPATDLVWKLVATEVASNLTRTVTDSSGFSAVNVVKDHEDLHLVSRDKNYPADFNVAIDFSSKLPQALSAGQSIQIKGAFKASGTGLIDDRYGINRYAGFVNSMGYVTQGASLDNVSLDVKVDHAIQGVDKTHPSETVTFTATAPGFKTSSGKALNYWYVEEATRGLTGSYSKITRYVYQASPGDSQTPPVDDLPKSDIKATLSRSGTLIIVGTDKADRIIVNQSGNRIVITGVPILVEATGQYVKDINPGTMIFIDISGKGGDDVIRLDQGSEVISCRTSIQGGDGNDLIVGAQYGSNTIHGGAGDDEIAGGEAADALFGDSGDDTLDGRGGVDQLFGGDGNDVLYGGAGNDTLYGDDGNDRLYGDLQAGGTSKEGTDMLFGGAGSDWLEAGTATEFADFGPANPGDRDWNAHVWAIGGTQMEDVRQNQSDTCSFLCSLASVAQRGTINLNAHIAYQGKFDYAVYLYNGTTWTEQKVRFDGTTAATDPYFANRGEYWTILFQRAYLQMVGRGPNDFLTGLLGESKALNALTGKSTSSDSWLNDTTFNNMESALRANRNVVCGTWGILGYHHNPVVVGNHAYTVTRVWRDAQGNRWVEIRNPWGVDGGSVTDANPNDGLVTMSWKDFSWAMQGVTIC